MKRIAIYTFALLALGLAAWADGPLPVQDEGRHVVVPVPKPKPPALAFRMKSVICMAFPADGTKIADEGLVEVFSGVARSGNQRFLYLHPTTGLWRWVTLVSPGGIVCFESAGVRGALAPAGHET